MQQDLLLSFRRSLDIQKVNKSKNFFSLVLKKSLLLDKIGEGFRAHSDSNGCKINRIVSNTFSFSLFFRPEKLFPVRKSDIFILFCTLKLLTYPFLSFFLSFFLLIGISYEFWNIGRRWDEHNKYRTSPPPVYSTSFDVVFYYCLWLFPNFWLHNYKAQISVWLDGYIRSFTTIKNS